MFGLKLQEEVNEIQRELNDIASSNEYHLKNTDVIMSVKQNQITSLSTAPNILDFDLMMEINKAFDENQNAIIEKCEALIATKSKMAQTVFQNLKEMHDEQ